MLVPTSRLLSLCLGALVPMVLSGSHDKALGVMGIWMAACILAALIDVWFALPNDDIVWSRDHDPKMSLGRWNAVTMTLHNRSDRAVTFQVRDAVPILLVSRRHVRNGQCAAGGSWTARYDVFPLHRGEYILGPLAVRYLGPLGLAWAQRVHRVESPVRVYPDLLAVNRYEALRQGRRMDELGLRNSRRWGSGTDFDSLRDYTPDDDYRRIDWKATARVHRPIAVEYRTEQSQNLILVLDAGRLMSTRLPLEWTDETQDPDAIRSTAARPPVALTRLDYAVNTSLFLAFVSQKNGDRVGLLSFSDRVLRYLPPAPGRSQFLRLTDDLYSLEPEPTETDYSAGLGYLAGRSRRRSLIVIFTDLSDAENVETLVTNTEYVSRQHLVLVVTLRDPGVERLRALPPDTPERAFQGAVARRLLDARERTLRQLQHRGVLTLDVSADQLSSSVINRYFAIKARTAL